MSRDELFFSSWPVPPLFTVFYFEFRASHHGTNDFSRVRNYYIPRLFSRSCARQNYRKIDFIRENEFVEFQLTFLGQMCAAHFCIAI